MNPTEEQLKNRQSIPTGNPNFSGVTSGGEYATMNSPKAIDVSSLNSNIKPFVPPTPEPQPDYSGVTKGAIAGATSPMGTYTTPNGAVLNADGSINTPAPVTNEGGGQAPSLDFLIERALLGQPKSDIASLAEQFKRTYGVDETKLAQDRADSQKRVDDLRSQLAKVQTETTTSQLGLETQDVRRTAGVLDRMQGQIAREQAIKALPITAQLNFEQGRLDSAKADIKTMLDLTYKDEQIKTANADKAYERAYAVATNEQKIELDKLKAENEVKKTELDNLQTLKNSYIKSALDNGDFKTAGALASAKTQKEFDSIVSKMIVQPTFDQIKDDAGNIYEVSKDKNGQIIGTPKLVFKAEPKAGTGGGNLSNLDLSSPTYFDDLLTQSSGGKKPNQVETIRPIQKSVAVINQLSDLQKSINKSVTDPILGTLKKFNPYDFDARAIQAQLQAVVPNLARGVYGEVGVLTDADVRNYIKTLPNIQGTKKQNDFVMAMTLKTVQRNFESQLETLASAGYDVSGFKNQYQKTKNLVNKMESDLGITDGGTPQSSPDIQEVNGVKYIKSSDGLYYPENSTPPATATTTNKVRTTPALPDFGAGFKPFNLFNF